MNRKTNGRRAGEKVKGTTFKILAIVPPLYTRAYLRAKKFRNIALLKKMTPCQK